MQSFLNDVPLVVEVARQKSFTRAAEILGLGASTLSRRIKLLEERMGVLLFYRDTRNVELTDNGLLLLERCEFILEEAHKAYEAIVQNMQDPTGLLRICMFRDLYDSHLKEGIVDFATRWPDIRMDLTFVEHAVDMRTAPYDVAFLISPSIAPPLVARKLMTIKPLVYASPHSCTATPHPRLPRTCNSCPASCWSASATAGPWATVDARSSSRSNRATPSAPWRCAAISAWPGMVRHCCAT